MPRVAHRIATRLIRTEGNHIAGQAKLERFEDAGIERYMFHALLELRTCKVCGRLDGKSFPVKEQRVGVNMHPMHPNCRCFIAPDMTNGELASITRSAQTGADNWEPIPADMTWEQWREKYVDNSPEMKAAERMEANRPKDRAQWKEYKQILGKNAPKSLAAFQKMKYTEPEKWDELKSLQRGVKWQKDAQKNGIVSGSVHRVPFDGSPNTVFDNYRDGILESRRYYGRTGKPRLDIDLTDHGNPKKHPVVPHRHGWIETDSGGLRRSENHDQPLTKADELANADILKGGA